MTTLCLCRDDPEGGDGREEEIVAQVLRCRLPVSGKVQQWA
jgi:hypothetical protein